MIIIPNKKARTDHMIETTVQNRYKLQIKYPPKVINIYPIRIYKANAVLKSSKDHLVWKLLSLDSCQNNIRRSMKVKMNSN
jgi:hypothetical protein